MTIQSDISTAENFFKSVYSKIREDVAGLETDAVALEKAVAEKIDAFVAGIKAELLKLHSHSKTPPSA
jgi:hypothetical protein